MNAFEVGSLGAFVESSGLAILAFLSSPLFLCGLSLSLSLQKHYYHTVYADVATCINHGGYYVQ
jgi:hypothetical protein